MPKLRIMADAASLIKNITKFFTKDDAHIQELLQNARRANAKKVTIDIKPEIITISDDGHGVYDPQRLITIGGSQWYSDVKSEVPAGMGLFSCFNKASEIGVRSADWNLNLDYASICDNQEPELEEGLDIISGTEITLYCKEVLEGTREEWRLYQTNLEREAYRWASVARYMPYETEILINGGCNPSQKDNVESTLLYDHAKPNEIGMDRLLVEPFDPTKEVPGSKRQNYDWGHIQVRFLAEERRRSGNLNHISIISQGVEISWLNIDLSDAEPTDKKHDLELLVFVNPGEIDLRLPDRHEIIKNDKSKRILEQALGGVGDLLVRMLNEDAMPSPLRSRTQAAILSLDKKQMWNVKHELRAARIHQLGGYRTRLITAEILRNEEPILTEEMEDQTIVKHFNADQKIYFIDKDNESHKAVLDALENAKVYENIEVTYNLDPRGDGLPVLSIECIVARRGKKKRNLKLHSITLPIPKDEVNVGWDNEFAECNDTDLELVLIHTEPDGIPGALELDEFYQMDISDCDDKEAVWRTHELSIFLQSLSCDTFLTRGMPDEIDTFFKKYSDDQALIGPKLHCRLTFGSEGTIILREGKITHATGEIYFKDDKGKAEILSKDWAESSEAIPF